MNASTCVKLCCHQKMPVTSLFVERSTPLQEIQTARTGGCRHFHFALGSEAQISTMLVEPLERDDFFLTLHIDTHLPVIRGLMDIDLMLLEGKEVATYLMMEKWQEAGYTHSIGVAYYTIP